MKNNIYYLISALLCLTIVNKANAQAEETPNRITLMYSEVYDAPEELSLFSINLPLYHGSFSKLNFSLYDLNGRIHYVGKGKINGGIAYRLGLADKLLPKTEETNEIVRQNHVMSIFDPEHAQNFDAYATYFFLEKEKNVNTNFTLKTEGHYYRTTYYSKVRTKAIFKHGINLGYSQGFTWYNMNNTDLKLYNRPNDITKEVNLQSMSTVQHYSFIKLGYQRQRIVNAKMKFEKYGVRGVQQIIVTGANLIYALQNDFDDVYLGDYQPNNGDKVYYERYEVDPSNKFLNVGIEFYQRFIFKRNLLSFEYRAGYLPGMMNNLNFMFNVGVNFQIDFFRNNLKNLDKLIDREYEKSMEIDAQSKRI